jgi:hypothetical protein
VRPGPPEHGTPLLPCAAGGWTRAAGVASLVVLRSSDRRARAALRFASHETCAFAFGGSVSARLCSLPRWSRAAAPAESSAPRRMQERGGPRWRARGHLVLVRGRRLTHLPRTPPFTRREERGAVLAWRLIGGQNDRPWRRAGRVPTAMETLIDRNRWHPNRASLLQVTLCLSEQRPHVGDVVLGYRRREHCPALLVAGARLR